MGDKKMKREVFRESGLKRSQVLGLRTLSLCWSKIHKVADPHETL